MIITIDTDKGTITTNGVAKILDGYEFIISEIISSSKGAFDDDSLNPHYMQRSVEISWLDTYPYRDIELFEALDEFENREKKYTEPQKNCVESQKNT